MRRAVAVLLLAGAAACAGEQKPRNRWPPKLPEGVERVHRKPDPTPGDGEAGSGKPAPMPVAPGKPDRDSEEQAAAARKAQEEAARKEAEAKKAAEAKKEAEAKKAAEAQRPPDAKPAPGADEPGPPPAPPAAPGFALGDPGPAVPELIAFLSVPNATAAEDGSVKLPWEGPGAAQMRISWDALERRNEEVQSATLMIASLMNAVTRFYESGGADAQKVRGKLVELAARPLDEARASYHAAVDREGRRLFYVERALEAAAAARQTLPGVAPDLVARRSAAIKSGQLGAQVERRVAGYRNLALGLVSYIDEDRLDALEQMKRAAEALPDVAVAHAVLGSLYYLFEQPERATSAWKAALEIDPANETVRTALQQYGRKTR